MCISHIARWRAAAHFEKTKCVWVFTFGVNGTVYPIVIINVSPRASLKKIPVRVFHPRLTAGDPGHLAPIVVGRPEKHTTN